MLKTRDEAMRGGMNEPIVMLVFNNADATPRSTVIRVSADSVPHVMAWYGAYFAGDRYTVTLDGRNVRMDMNGGPAK